MIVSRNRLQVDKLEPLVTMITLNALLQLCVVILSMLHVASVNLVIQATSTLTMLLFTHCIHAS